MAGKIKGHTVIELTDVNTGEKEYYEHNNMQTNALAKILSNMAVWLGYGKINEYMLPMIGKALGGIYVFDNTLTENVDNIYLPNISGAKLTGYAGYATSDGLDNKRGDFNTLESGEVANGYKFVWDFGTNDANGEIAAVALTHHIAGYTGHHYNPLLALISDKARTGVTNDNYKGLNYDVRYKAVGLKRPYVAYDETTGEIVAIEKTTATNIDVRYYRLTYDNISLTSKLAVNELIRTEKISISDSLLSETKQIVWGDGKDGFYYGFVSSSDGTKLYVCKINKTTLEYTPTVAYTPDKPIMQIRYGFTYNGYLHFAAIRNGYLYVITQAKEVAKIPLSNFNEVQVINGTYYEVTRHTNFGEYSAYFVYKDFNDNIVTNGYIIGNDDSIEPNGQYKGLYYDAGYSGCNGVCNLMGTNYYITTYDYSETNGEEYLVPNLQYLATINNLDTPVTKTAAKTMKITYTLTYAD